MDLVLEGATGSVREGSEDFLIIGTALITGTAMMTGTALMMGTVPALVRDPGLVPGLPDSEDLPWLDLARP